MAEYLIQGSTLTAIADAIRIKGRIYDNMSPTQIPSMITTHLMSVGVLDALIANPTASSAKTAESFNIVSAPSPYTGMYLIQDTTLRSICNALRTQGNFSGPIKISEIPQCIDEKLLSQDDINDFYNKTLTYIYNTTATTIGTSAFKDCTSLSSVEFTKCTTVGSSAFQGCTAINYLSMPLVTTVNASAFANCKSITNMTIGVTEIKSADAVGVTLYKNSKLTKLSLPNCVSIYSSVCQECFSLSSIYAPLLDNLTQSAFYKCSSLTEINFSKLGTTTTYGVGANCFAYCINLSKVSLPQIVSMNGGAFNYCSALKEFYAPKLVGQSTSAIFTGTTALEKITVGHATVPAIWSGQKNLVYFSDSNATQIGAQAFQGCTSLTLEGCTFGASNNCTLTSINASAFQGCTAITSIKTSHFPQTTPQIIVGSSAFAQCTNLTTVNCNAIVSINQKAFQSCTALSTVTLPNALYIGLSTFQGCTNLSYLYAPKVTSIYVSNNYFPIAGCASLSYINFNNLATVQTKLFQNRTALQTLIINNATAIYESAFQGCTGLTSIHMNNVSKLTSAALFEGCTNINENRIFASNLTAIDGNIVFRNTGFTSITSSVFPKLTSLGYNTFQSCQSLTYVNLPTLTYLGRSVFGQCTTLSYLSVPAVTSVYTSSSWVPTSGCTGLQLANFNGMSAIPTALFRTLTNLKSVYINGATAIYANAFSGCTSLSTITMNALTTLTSESVFFGCTALTGTGITAPVLSSITGTRAFGGAGLVSLTSTIFPALNYLGNYTFQSCTSLTSVNLPLVTYVGLYTFSGCTNLSYVSMPAVSSIYTTSNYVPFRGCSNIRFANFNSLLIVPRYLFTDCANLSQVHLNKATTINAYAFQGCLSLSTLNLPKATLIASSACIGNTGLRNVQIGSTVQNPVALTISAQAFSGCTNLSTISILHTSLATLQNSNAFTGTGITSTTGKIIVPASLYTSYQTRAQWSYFKNIMSTVTF